jgi:PIN domain nuclease of toxin-antitoxin system
LGKLSVDIALLINQIQSNGFQSLAVGMRHAATLSGLPPIHKDPFDRMLIAQALSEPLRLLTADRLLASYSDLVELV